MFNPVLGPQLFISLQNSHSDSEFAGAPDLCKARVSFVLGANFGIPLPPHSLFYKLIQIIFL